MVFSFLYIYFHFLGCYRDKVQKIAQNEKYQLHLSHTISQEQYSLWSWFLVHLCKLMMSPVFFFYIYIYISIFWAVRGVRGQKIGQNEKCQLQPSNAISQEQYSLWSWFWYTCVKWYLQEFFVIFLYIFIFWAVRGSKRAKMAQDDKKFCLLHFVSREPYVIWLSFMLLHLCYSCVKWHIQEFFSFFQSFDFWDCYWGKRTKNSPKWQNSVCCTWYLRNNTSCNCHLWYTSIKW